MRTNLIQRAVREKNLDFIEEHSESVRLVSLLEFSIENGWTPYFNRTVRREWWLSLYSIFLLKDFTCRVCRTRGYWMELWCAGPIRILIDVGDIVHVSGIVGTSDMKLREDLDRAILKGTSASMSADADSRPILTLGDVRYEKVLDAL